MTGKARANGEGSIYPHRNGWAAYVWVTLPSGLRDRKYIYGADRDKLHARWIELQNKARQGPVATSTPTLAEYLDRWLDEVIRPNREIGTYAQYETLVRLHVKPGIGRKKLDKLVVRDVQTWLNGLTTACQCCAQGKDARRPAVARKKGQAVQRCCAIGQCCEMYPSWNTIRLVRAVLRSALSQAIVDELISRNVASLVKVPKSRVRRRRKSGAWSVEDARTFLEAARARGDRLYAAFVLMLVLGLRKGELLGLTWSSIDFDAETLDVSWQLHRVLRELRHTETTKTEESSAELPLIEVCAAALKAHREVQNADKEEAGEAWHDSGLVFTTKYGRPVEPRNFNRAFDSRCAWAGVPRIKVHDTRHTCASLLAALDVHPRVAMQILRHTRIAMTMEVYTEVTSEATREALRKLGDSLRPAVQPEKEDEAG